MHSIFLGYLTGWRPLGYSLVFLGMIFEGDIFVLSVSFLTRLHFFDFFDIFLVMLGGVIFGDIFWFWLGKHISASGGRFSRKIIYLAEKVNIDFDKGFFKKLLVSKFIYGTHHLTLVKIGLQGMSFVKYMKSEAIASLIWVITIGFLGYVFGSSYLLVAEYFKYAEIGLLIAILLFFFFGRKAEKNFLDKNNN